MCSSIIACNTWSFPTVHPTCSYPRGPSRVTRPFYKAEEISRKPKEICVVLLTFCFSTFLPKTNMAESQGTLKGFSPRISNNAAIKIEWPLQFWTQVDCSLSNWNGTNSLAVFLTALRISRKRQQYTKGLREEFMKTRMAVMSYANLFGIEGPVSVITNTTQKYGK